MSKVQIPWHMPSVSQAGSPSVHVMWFDGPLTFLTSNST